MIGGTIHDTIQGEFNVDAAAATSSGTCCCSLLVGDDHLPRRGALDARAADPRADLGDASSWSSRSTSSSRAAASTTSRRASRRAVRPPHWKGVLFGVLYGVLLFTGFETSANLGEETERARTATSRAPCSCRCSSSRVFYIIGSLRPGLGIPLQPRRPGQERRCAALRPRRAGRHRRLRRGGDPTPRRAGRHLRHDRGPHRLRRLGVAGHLRPGARPEVARAASPRSRGTARRSGRARSCSSSTRCSSCWSPRRRRSRSRDYPEYVSMFSWLSTFGGFAIAVIYLLISVGALRGLRDVGQASGRSTSPRWSGSW